MNNLAGLNKRIAEKEKDIELNISYLHMHKSAKSAPYYQAMSNTSVLITRPASVLAAAIGIQSACKPCPFQTRPSLQDADRTPAIYTVART